MLDIKLLSTFLPTVWHFLLLSISQASIIGNNIMAVNCSVLSLMLMYASTFVCLFLGWFGFLCCFLFFVRFVGGFFVCFVVCVMVWFFFFLAKLFSKESNLYAWHLWAACNKSIPAAVVTHHTLIKKSSVAKLILNGCIRPYRAPEIIPGHSFKLVPVSVPAEARKLVHSQYIPFCSQNESMARLPPFTVRDAEY